MVDISKIKLPDGTTYNLKDSYVRTNYRALSNNDFDTINVTELNAGDTIVTGAARFLNTINGSISGNAATATSANILKNDTTYRDSGTYSPQTDSQTLKVFLTRENNAGVGISSTGYGGVILSGIWQTGAYNTELWLGMGDHPWLYHRGKNNGTYTAWCPIGKFTQTTPTTGQVVITDGATGGIKSSGYTIAKSVPNDAVFTDHYAWTDITGKPSTFTPSTHYHYELKTIGDQRTTSTTPNTYSDRLIFQGLKTQSYIGNPGGTSGYSYLLGLRGWGDSSGGDAHELAFNNNGVYYRHGATTTWGDWVKIFTSADTYTGTLTSSQVTTALGFTPTANTGTITSVKTTAGAHTTINVSSGAANFNVPTKTSHLTNDSGFVTNDTKNTAGSTDTSSKIYLIGATSQAANPQTYSDNEVYTTSGVLTTKSVQVGGGSATMQYNTTTKSIDFVFAS